MCKRKRNFIDEAGLRISGADREAFLSKLTVYEVEPLEEAYPPYGEIISETPTIHNKWFRYFKYGKQPDKRMKRLPIHHLDPKKLALDIGPTEGARLVTPDGKLVGLVVREFFLSEDAVAWADAAIKTQASHSRNIRVCPAFYYYTL